MEAPIGVFLPQAKFKDWGEAHPEDPVNKKEIQFVPGFGKGVVKPVRFGNPEGTYLMTEVRETGATRIKEVARSSDALRDTEMQDAWEHVSAVAAPN